jgi:hypothetical protein
VQYFAHNGSDMPVLTEEMVLAKSRASNLAEVKALNCWFVFRCHPIEPDSRTGGAASMMFVADDYAHLAHHAQISIVRKLPNVEVLSLRLPVCGFCSLAYRSSVNKITSLRDVSGCEHLTELYLRKNSISNISELAALKVSHRCTVAQRM